MTKTQIKTQKTKQVLLLTNHLFYFEKVCNFKNFHRFCRIYGKLAKRTYYKDSYFLDKEEYKAKFNKDLPYNRYGETIYFYTQTKPQNYTPYSCNYQVIKLGRQKGYNANSIQSQFLKTTTICRLLAKYLNIDLATSASKLAELHGFLRYFGNKKNVEGLLDMEVIFSRDMLENKSIDVRIGGSLRYGFGL